jgi:hypothetical protein
MELQGPQCGLDGAQDRWADIEDESTMADAPEQTEDAMEEDIDPLDAFMSNLDHTIPEADFMNMKKRPEALYGEDVLGEETEIVEMMKLQHLQSARKRRS